MGKSTKVVSVYMLVSKISSHESIEKLIIIKSPKLLASNKLKVYLHYLMKKLIKSQEGIKKKANK